MLCFLPVVQEAWKEVQGAMLALQQQRLQQRAPPQQQPRRASSGRGRGAAAGRPGSAASTGSHRGRAVSVGRSLLPLPRAARSHPCTRPPSAQAVAAVLQP
jgi:hypothetical protein